MNAKKSSNCLYVHMKKYIDELHITIQKLL